MRTTKSVEKTVEITDDVLCNKCGKTCYNGFHHSGLIGAKVHGNYGSKAHGKSGSLVLQDGDIFNFDICEKCFAELSETFLIPAKTGNSWFPEENEEDDKKVQEALNSLKSSIQDVATAMKDTLKDGGFIKFGDQVATKLEKGLEDLKEKMK